MTDFSGLHEALSRLEEHLLAQWVPVQPPEYHSTTRKVDWLPTKVFRRVGLMVTNILRRIFGRER